MARTRSVVQKMPTPYVLLAGLLSGLDLALSDRLIDPSARVVISAGIAAGVRALLAIAKTYDVASVLVRSMPSADNPWRKTRGGSRTIDGSSGRSLLPSIALDVVCYGACFVVCFVCPVIEFVCVNLAARTK
jgi:hypothetical protein